MSRKENWFILNFINPYNIIIMKKSTVNFIINAILFLCMAAITGIGFLIKYVLIPGSERWEKYGRNVELSVWGMDRHEWAYIHLIIGFVILALVLLHIVLHWNMVMSVYNRLFKKKAIYSVLSIAFIAVGIIIMVVPFFMEAQISAHEEGRNEKKEFRKNIEQNKKQEAVQLERHSSGKEVSQQKPRNKKVQHENKNIEQHDKNNHAKSSLEIRGYMSLNDVAKKYQISCDLLKSELGIPQTTSNIERLGKLKRKYDFKMSDIEKIINKQQENKE